MDSNELILFMGFLISVVTGAAVIYNSITQNKSFKANIILNLTDSFSSQEMNDAMKSLKDSVQQILSGDVQGLPHSVTVFDQKRRLITHHFFKIFLLRKSNVIDDKILKTVAQEEDIQFLIKYIEPLETAINKNYNREMFDMYRNLLESDFFYPNITTKTDNAR
jgi:hypothetical protein